MHLPGAIDSPQTLSQIKLSAKLLNFSIYPIYSIDLHTIFFVSV